MAFANKIGNVLKQAINLNPSMYQSIRCMSSSKLFIGGLSYQTDEQSLKEAFGQHGEVLEARVIVDRDTGRSRGFGFVTFASAEEAQTAMSSQDGKNLGYANVLSFSVHTSGSTGYSGGASAGYEQNDQLDGSDNDKDNEPDDYVNKRG
ncbi:hypothetical protein QJS10_CPB15g01433 [Acorus calamus]|uniref:RRM domain-containing protein n=1 Tax=Acorus calamus TaxID=4465 RepID=A0AAV9D3C0_ACOCL|nr:hypothetical protein QJS10_CPB15g01433 [Acorus calamus]